MNLDEFAEKAEKMVDYVADYIDSISQKRVLPNVSPGYLSAILPSTNATRGASVKEIMEEFCKYILPGLSHSQHPGYHAFLPSCSSYPATLGSMLAETLGHVGFDWDKSPAGCELETITVDWYGKLIGLPRCFLPNAPNSRGGGMMLRSNNECIFIAMVTARCSILRKLLDKNPSLSTAVLLSSLVVYCSEETQSLIQKIAVVTLVNVRILRTGEDHRLRSREVEKAIKDDEEIGLIPFFVNIVLGSSWCGACDPINEIGPVCKRHGVWLHVDASYAGNAMVCPEFRHYLNGIEYASSVNSNPARWMPMHVDCAVMFVRDRFAMKDAVIVDRTQFGYSFLEMDWGYPSKTEFRALEFWIVMRSYGVQGMQRHIRNHVRLAEMFEGYVRSDDRFLFRSRNFGIVCFRLKGSDEKNKILKRKINATGELFVSPSHISQEFSIRFVVCTERATENDIKYAWKIICEQADEVLKDDVEEPSDCPTNIFEEYYRFSFL